MNGGSAPLIYIRDLVWKVLLKWNRGIQMNSGQGYSISKEEQAFGFKGRNFKTCWIKTQKRILRGGAWMTVHCWWDGFQSQSSGLCGPIACRKGSAASRWTRPENSSVFRDPAKICHLKNYEHYVVLYQSYIDFPRTKTATGRYQVVWCGALRDAPSWRRKQERSRSSEWNVL